MSSPSNMYAEKIYSEHPLGLWPLDESVDYISLIPSDENRRVFDSEYWTVTGASSVVENESVPDRLFPDSYTTRIYGSVPAGLSGQIRLESKNLVKFSDLVQEMETFCIGAHIYALSQYVTGYSIGYEYTDPNTLLPVESLEYFPTTVSNKWAHISKTFNILDSDADIRIIIKINYINVNASTEDYGFFINGITFGQWSEEFNSISLGMSAPVVKPGDLGINILNDGVSVTTAKAYGIEDSDGYYLSIGKSLSAKNSGVPMVFGSSSVTSINKLADNVPSLIIPGKGFLNDLGKYKTYTAEMWLRIESNGVNGLKRIFGPIGSTDGLYVDGPFIRMKVANSYGSHFVGEWSRPMLIDFRYSGNGSADLLLNGEEVISIDFDMSILDFPDQYASNGKNQDWLGFYAYEEIPTIDIDCIAIYTYQVSSILAKRRFSYGQAVEFPESVNTAYGGTSVFIDYPYADYTQNFMYPEMGRFDRGIIENLSVENSSISAPNYQLPEIFLSEDKSVSEWYDENIQNTTTSVQFLNNDGYLFFNKLNFLKQDTKAIYVISQIDDLIDEEQIVIKIENSLTGKSFTVSLIGESVFYKLDDTVLYEDVGVTSGEVFIGINIDGLVGYFGQQLSSFFGNRGQLSVYIAGDRSLAKTFSGMIKKVGFCNERNFNKIKDLFSIPSTEEIIADAGAVYFGNDPAFWSSVVDGGTPDSFSSISAMSHTASYTLIPKIAFDKLSLDIAIDSYWEDFIPLTYFAQYVSDTFNKKFYDLDFVQFNIGYPSPNKFIQDTYDTTDSIVKTYISFQYISAGSNNDLSYYTRVATPKNGVISPGDEWVTTAYEVVDGSVIYTPIGEDIKQLALVTHMEIVVDGIKTNPIKVKSIQYASEAFNENSSNPVGTRFGNNIYPYKKYGSYYDYKAKNPFKIYKGSTPYLYLTKNSGIEKVGDYDPLVNRGLAIPVNENIASEFKVIAMQSSIRFNGDSFPSDPVQIFEIQSKDTYTKFFMVANDESGKRARIYGINARTGEFENGISFYINGVMVREPVISLNSWTFLSINFARTLDFGSFVGGFRITGPILINNISMYKSTNLQEIQRTEIRPWYRVKQSALSDLEWQLWTSTYTWNGVLVFSSSDYYGIDPSTIYKAYMGTNKIIADDDRKLVVGKYEYRAQRYLSSNIITTTPV